MGFLFHIYIMFNDIAFIPVYYVRNTTEIARYE